jgi:hypothetical protein
MNKAIPPSTIPAYIEMGWRDRAQERKRRAENAANDDHWHVAADKALAPYGLRLIPNGRVIHVHDERLNRRRVSGSVWDGRKMIWRKPTVGDYPHPLGKLTNGPKIRCAHRSWKSARQLICSRRDLPPPKPRDADDPHAAEAFLAARGHLANPTFKRAATILAGEVNAAIVEMRDLEVDAPQKPWVPCWWSEYWSRIGSPPGFKGPLTAHPAWRWIGDEMRVFGVASTWFELTIPWDAEKLGTKPLKEPWTTKAPPAVQEFAWILWWEANRRRAQMQLKFPPSSETGPGHRLNDRVVAGDRGVCGWRGERCCRLKTCPLQCGRHLM